MSEYLPVPLNPYIAVNNDTEVSILQRTLKRILFYKRITLYYADFGQNEYFVSQHYYLFDKCTYVKNKQFTNSEEALNHFNKVTK